MLSDGKTQTAAAAQGKQLSVDGQTHRLIEVVLQKKCIVEVTSAQRSAPEPVDDLPAKREFGAEPQIGANQIRVSPAGFPDSEVGAIDPRYGRKVDKGDGSLADVLSAEFVAQSRYQWGDLSPDQRTHEQINNQRAEAADGL